MTFDGVYTERHLQVCSAQKLVANIRFEAKADRSLLRQTVDPVTLVVLKPNVGNRDTAAAAPYRISADRVVQIRYRLKVSFARLGGCTLVRNPTSVQQDASCTERDQCIHIVSDENHCSTGFAKLFH